MINVVDDSFGAGERLEDHLMASLQAHEWLKEIRVRFINGSLSWAIQVNGAIEHGTEKIEEPNDHYYEMREFLNGTDYDPEEIYHILFLRRWQKYKPPKLEVYLEELRESKGLSVNDVVELLLSDKELAHKIASAQHTKARGRWRIRQRNHRSD